MHLIRAILIALACLFSLVTRAQNDGSLLYKISGNGLVQPSYLFGTIHLMCPQDIQISETTKEKVIDSEQLVLELDFDQPNMMQEMQQKLMLPEGKTMRDMMSEEDYASISQFLKDSLGVQMQAIERFNPIVLYSMLATQMLKCQPGSYEMSLTSLAKADEQEVIGLETIDEQIAAFNAVAEEEQVDYITETIEDYEKARQDFMRLIDAYKAGDVDALYEVSKETMDEVAGMEQHMLIDRNQKWIPAIASLIKDQSSFVAVGAGHSGGEKGLLALLKAEGYTVEPVAQ